MGIAMAPAGAEVTGADASEAMLARLAERDPDMPTVVSVGTELFTIIDPSSMRLDASVPSEDLTTLRVGVGVEFSVRGYDKPFRGRIERIAPQADATTRQRHAHKEFPWTPAS